MSQTLLVVAAVVVLAVFGLNRHRGIAADERASIGREIETAVLETADRWAGLARDLAFDEADVNSEVMRIQGNVTALSTRLGPDADETLSNLASLDDVDDLAGLSLTEYVNVGSGVVPFTVTIDATTGVRYADPRTWALSATPTTAKILTLVVREVTTGATGRPPVVVTLPVRVSSSLQFVRTR